jgi:Ras-related protein Rab-13
MNYDDKCQLLIIGDSTVGKTSILSKYSSKTFNENYLATVGLDFFTKDEIIDTKIIRIKIWDTAGQERYKALTRCFFQKAQGVIIVFDVSNQKSFNDLNFWIESMNTQLSEDIDSIPVIIIGNKIDLPKRVISKDKASDFSKEYHLNYYETSAMSGDGIETAIKDLVKKVIKNGGNKGGKYNLRISESNKKESKCC